MSFWSSKKAPSDCEAQCPDCGVTLSRLADMNRHRKTKHPDGTETKFPCPWFGCAYRALQKGNLKAHLDAKHSNGPQYPCPECDRRFSDAAARIRHRKKTHGYVPYHTKEYLARQALIRKERVVQGVNKAVSNKSRRQWVARAAPDGLTNASSSALPPNVPDAAYHDDFWRVLVNIASSYAPKQQRSQDVPLSLPFSTMPGYDTSNAIQPFYMQPEELLQPSLTFSDFPIDYSGFLGPQLNAIPSQGQAFGESFTEDYGTPLYNGLWNA